MFSRKSAEGAEGKAVEESIARKRVRKLLKNKGREFTTEGTEIGAQRTRRSRDWWEVTPHPGGNADGCEKKGVAGRAIRKVMKTKGEKCTSGCG